MILLTGAYAWLEGLLETAGAGRVTGDIRNVSPNCVLISPPTIRSINGRIAELDFPVSVLSAPPASEQSVVEMLGRADQILALTPLLVVDGKPETYVVGQQELPAYTLTCRFTYAADPEGD